MLRPCVCDSSLSKAIASACRCGSARKLLKTLSVFAILRLVRRFVWGAVAKVNHRYGDFSLLQRGTPAARARPLRRTAIATEREISEKTSVRETEVGLRGDF